MKSNANFGLTQRLGLLIILFAAHCLGGDQSMLTVAPTPADMPTVPIVAQVRLVGQESWQPLFVYRADSMSKRPRDFGGAEGFVTFAFSGEVELRVTLPEVVRQAVVRPSLRDRVETRATDRTLSFRLNRPRYLTVEVNYLPPEVGPVPRYTLYVLADAPEVDAPRADEPTVKALPAGPHALNDFLPGEKTTLFLEAGVHTVAGGVVPLYSGKTLYLAAGAILRARVIGENVRQAQLRGRGILDGSPFPREPGDWRSEGEQGFIFLRRGDGITIDGPIIYNCPYWNIVAFGTTHLTIRNHKAITWKVNNDGVQPRSCTDLLVEHCFLKCADDCIAIKTRRAAEMASRRLVFRDLVLWNDIPGNPMEIGHTSQADLLEDVTFQNIEVIHSEGQAHTIDMCIIDHCAVRKIRYENIFVEGTKVRDIGLRIATSRYTTDAQRGRIQDVTIRGYFSDESPQGGEITGFDPEHLVENISIENFVIFAQDPARRQVVKELDALGLKLQHARNVRLNAGTNQPSTK